MENILDDYADMALFVRVVETKSFTAAAAKLGLSKSAASARISALESRIGVRLLQRTTRRVVPTDDGLRFFDHCARMVQAADDARLEIAGSVQEVKGILRITAPPAFARHYLVPQVAKFMEQHPHVEIYLHSDERFNDLYAGDLDLAIRFSRQLDEVLVARKLMDEKVVLCASPAYLARHGTPQFPTELESHQCFRYVYSKHEYRFADSGGEYCVVVPSGRFTSNDGEVLREMALRGLGIVSLPLHIVADSLDLGRLTLLLQDFHHDLLGVYAVYLHRRAPRRLHTFVDFLLEQRLELLR